MMVKTEGGSKKNGKTPPVEAGVNA